MGSRRRKAAFRSIPANLLELVNAQARQKGRLPMTADLAREGVPAVGESVDPLYAAPQPAQAGAKDAELLRECREILRLSRNHTVNAGDCDTCKLIDRIDAALRQSGAGSKDAELLEWACNNPEAAMRRIQVDWAMAGKGFRESYFNFRGAIDAALKERISIRLGLEKDRT